MPKQVNGRAAAKTTYWETRVRSPEFKQALAGMIAGELRALARRPVQQILDPDLVRTMIGELDRRLINRVVVGDLAFDEGQRVLAHLRGREQSLADLLDQKLIAGLDAVLGSVELPPSIERFVGELMHKDFIRKLLTGVIFTAIVSFHGRVNPLFGAIAARAMETQIKSFIQLFMPMLEDQAVAFAVDHRNRRLLLDLARSVIQHLLTLPLGDAAALVSSGNAKAARALVRKAAKDERLAELLRQCALAVWDDLYEAIRERPVGDFLRLEENAEWLAQRCAEVALPALSRPAVLEFIAAEVGLARAAEG